VGQTEILVLLEQNPKTWYSIDEIKDILQEQNGFTGNVWQQVNRLCATEKVETRLQRLKTCRWGYKRVIKHKEEHI